MANDKYTILYARLSQDDGSQGESNSINNQRLILEKYAKENGFENLKFMADDGYSGTNFNRPSFKELMLLVENGQVETIIVKDMSRFGREYLEVGRYTEIVFPNYDVRFIAIGDGIDSLYGNDDFTPFKNIINELYAKDCSRKIRAAKRAKAETGAWLGGKPPYGYMRDPENPKSHLVPDEESAEVVKLIFSLCVGGKGPNQIARELKKREILTPAHYYYRKEGKKNAKLNLEQPYKWHSENVIRILESEVYLGHTISLVNTTKSYKNKKRVVRPTDEQVRFENTHKALVDKETWDILLLQAVITFAFYKTRSRWIVLLEKYNDDTQPASISIPDVLDDLFFTGMIIVFAFILPFSVYLRQPMTGIDILFAFTFSVSFLCTWAVFLKNKKDKWRYLPFLSLIGLLYTVTTHPVPNPIATTLILLCLFCVEMAASIGIQIYKAMAGGTKDLSL